MSDETTSDEPPRRNASAVMQARDQAVRSEALRWRGMLDAATRLGERAEGDKLLLLVAVERALVSLRRGESDIAQETLLKVVARVKADL